MGITPGNTKQSEAKKIISGSNLLVNCNEETPINSSLGRIQTTRCNEVLFVFVDNTAAWITISPMGLDVEQVIEKYGVPDALSTEILSKPDEPFRSGVVFRYDKIRLQVNLIEKTGSGYEITANTQVTYITYNDENNQEMLQNSVLDIWRGYGIYP